MKTLLAIQTELKIRLDMIIPIHVIKEIQDEAYNQALQDLADNDLLPDKEKNLKKYRK